MGMNGDPRKKVAAKLTCFTVFTIIKIHNVYKAAKMKGTTTRAVVHTVLFNRSKMTGARLFASKS